MKSFKFFIAAAILIYGANVVHAGSTQGESELNRAMIQAQRKVIVEANMQMDADTAKTFWPLYDEYIVAMQKPADRSTALLNDYAASWMDLSDEKAQSLLNDLLSVKEEQIKIKKTFSKKFFKKLPAKVVARFFQIDNKLESIVANELAKNVPLVH